MGPFAAESDAARRLGLAAHRAVETTLLPTRPTSSWARFANRGGRIRTGDPLLPKQVRYQAAPRPVLREMYAQHAALGTAARAIAPPGSSLAPGWTDV